MPLQAPYGKGPVDPFGIMGRGFNVDPASFGPYYGPAMRDILSLLQVDYPAIAGAQASTRIADPAGAAYQSTLQSGRANLAGRGLIGSGVEQGMVSAALGQLGGARAQAAGAGQTAAIQSRDAIQQQVMQQLAQIANARAQSQFAGQGLNIQQQMADFQKQMLGKEWPIITSQGNIMGQQGALQQLQWPFLGQERANAIQLRDLASQGANLGLLGQATKGGLDLLNSSGLSSFLGSLGGGGSSWWTDPNSGWLSPISDWSQLTGFLQ